MSEQMQEPAPPAITERIVDEIDRARAREYALLATLLSHSPDAGMIGRLALLRGDASPLGMAHTALGEAAGRTSEESAARQYFDLFTGLGEGLLLPYASHYQTGSLYGRPLARVRETLQLLGVERAGQSEPEDHVAILCEIMTGLIDGDIAAAPGADRGFFEQYLAPWVGRFFADLEKARSADLYASVGSLGRVFMSVETEAYSLST